MPLGHCAQPRAAADPLNAVGCGGRKRPAESSEGQCSIDFRNCTRGEINHEGPTEDSSRCSCPMQTSQVVQTSVCFGTLCNVPIQIRSDPHIPSGTSRTPDPITLSIRTKAAVEGFWVGFAQGELFACLARNAARSLNRLGRFGSECVHIEGIISTTALIVARNTWKKTGKSEIGIEVNVYGHPHVAKSVGDLLVTDKLFLQKPTADPRSLAYENPQCLPLPPLPSEDLANEMKRISDENFANSSRESSESDIDAILGYIPQPNFLTEVSVDVHVRTSLVKHQKEALDFMIRREIGDLPPTMSLWRLRCSDNGFVFYQNVITGSKNSSMEEPIGGILADEMGLGKTLSTLALIVGSLARAVDFALNRTRVDFKNWQNNVPAKSTIVVVPSALLLDSWMEEIERHILPRSITAYRYHGTGRRVDMTELLAHDVVLTTYATIAAEFCRGRSMLSRIQWYRIVLDEAHIIRNTSTKQFRAIHSLQAHIRWCLTGTPIQNSLEDLGALITFLRTPILDDQKLFRKHVTTPVLMHGSRQFVNLRRLLEALCLRRTKTLLNLPEPVTDTKILKLSDSESEAYHDFGESCRRVINQAISGHSLKKANHHVLQAILGMRLFCNDGPPAFRDKCGAQGLPSEPEDALSYLQARGESTCAQCSTDISTVYQRDDPSSGVLTNCRHLICTACLPEVEADLDDRTEDGRTWCPFCNLHSMRDSFFANTIVPNSTAQRKTYPTKLLALLEEIRKQNADDKSVIFSFWKKSLDIVADLFESNGVAFFFIHGRLQTGVRAKILAEFEQSNSTRVLLITFGTGGAGINKLMSANHIHILEPQWNPSIESQAIGRIQRLGQERSVKIVRYIMKETVEETVQSRQLRKMQLAHGGFALSADYVMNLICPSKGQTSVGSK